MRFILHTYGCQMNVRDSEAVTALLEAAGHTPVQREDDADLVVVNSCSVRAKAEDKALGKLGLLCATKRDRPDRLVGLMGCMAQRLGADIFARVPGLDFAVGTRRAGAIPRLVARALAGEFGRRVLPAAFSPAIPAGVSDHRRASRPARVARRRCAFVGQGHG